ncbi:MAG: hypothetical protein ABW123_14265 [Cystobacter sp.]
MSFDCNFSLPDPLPDDLDDPDDSREEDEPRLELLEPLELLVDPTLMEVTSAWLRALLLLHPRRLRIFNCR